MAIKICVPRSWKPHRGRRGVNVYRGSSLLSALSVPSTTTPLYPFESPQDGESNLFGAAMIVSGSSFPYTPTRFSDMTT